MKRVEMTGVTEDRIGDDNIVAAFTDNTGDRFSLFEKSLLTSRFFETLEKTRLACGKGKSDFFIVIKPNISMMLRRADIGTYTDPFFVIHLLRLLMKRGYTRLALVESGNLYGNWFENRSVAQVAARAGYVEELSMDRYHGLPRIDIPVRGGGVDGRVPLVDLTLETAPHDFGGETAPVGLTWMEADFRISLSGLKTHFYSYYTAAVKNVYGCLPEQDKVRAYHCRKKVGPWTARHIQDFPVHFSIVAAYSAADGWMGVKMKAIFTKPHTIIAGADILAVDDCSARLMGLAPEKSVMYQCLARYASPRPWRQVGNARPFSPWRNAPSLLPLISRLLEGNADIMDFGGSIATGGNDACFPLKPSSRSFLKSLLYSLSLPLSIGCDIGIWRLNARRRRFYRSLERVSRKIPFIAARHYIRERLEYFSWADLKELIRLAAYRPAESIDFSGHYLFIDGRETRFNGRVSTTVLAAVEILNHIKDEGGKALFDRIAVDIERLPTLCPELFDPAHPYAFCYR